MPGVLLPRKPVRNGHKKYSVTRLIVKSAKSSGSWTREFRPRLRAYKCSYPFSVNVGWGTWWVYQPRVERDTFRRVRNANVGSPQSLAAKVVRIADGLRPGGCFPTLEPRDLSGTSSVGIEPTPYKRKALTRHSLGSSPRFPTMRPYRTSERSGLQNRDWWGQHS